MCASPPPVLPVDGLADAFEFEGEKNAIKQAKTDLNTTAEIQNPKQKTKSHII